MKSILDPSFKYTSSANTDIAKTFARIRQIQRENAGTVVVERAKNVSPVRRPVRTHDNVT